MALDIIRERLNNQQLLRTRCRTPGEVVAWFGAVQAQDYPSGKWAIGLRLEGAVDHDIERAIAERQIVRTWPMRGTLHFVAAADVRWMLKLLTPPADRASAPRLYQAGLDSTVLSKSRDVVVRALEGGKKLSRPSIYRRLEEGGIPTTNSRGLFILQHLASEGMICFATHEGKQPTFALLDEWVPPGKMLERDEALAEIARRYFQSHGPATLRDFRWWTGLPAVDARVAVAAARSELEQATVSGTTFWMPRSHSIRSKRSLANLLPFYDEYLVAYADRQLMRSRIGDRPLPGSANALLDPMIIIDGQVVGRWKRIQEKNSQRIELQYLAGVSEEERRSIGLAAGRYADFIGVPVKIK